VLDWEAAARAPGAQRLALVRDLLAVRRDKIVPLLDAIAFAPDAARVDGTFVTAAWTHPSGGLRVVANLGDAPAGRPGDWVAGAPIWGGTPPDMLPPWSVFWSRGP
jgi:hypothetical protein